MHVNYVVKGGNTRANTHMSLRKYTMCMFSVTRVIHMHKKKEKYSGAKVRNTGANTHG